MCKYRGTILYKGREQEVQSGSQVGAGQDEKIRALCCYSLLLSRAAAVAKALASSQAAPSLQKVPIKLQANQKGGKKKSMAVKGREKTVHEQ